MLCIYVMLYLYFLKEDNETGRYCQLTSYSCAAILPSRTPRLGWRLLMRCGRAAFFMSIFVSSGPCCVVGGSRRVDSFCVFDRRFHDVLHLSEER